LSSVIEFDEAQLAAARAKAWHQDGNAVLTLEAARDWVNACGLVLFAPRPAQLPVPAPTLVEATLGMANAAPTLAETDTARGLVSRLVGEGLALPLNLLGVPGDSPDFVVSAQVFSYIFTMRGDKAWKQPPSTSGAVRVSPLGLRVYEVLTERGPMSAAELATELGREVTEAAILRSLSELWSQVRVLPLLQIGDGVTLWELTSRRFTKSIKAGANAGLPKALSAVTSLYLAQVFAASEEDVTTFVSPLTARSRVREVLMRWWARGSWRRWCWKAKRFYIFRERCRLPRRL
jgi:23S rRNA pseudouridine2605 synthase